MLYCDWSVIGRLIRRMSLTRSHHATAVGPIRFSNRSNNCRVGKINGRRSSLVRSHHAIFVFSRLCVQQKTKIAWCEPGLNITIWNDRVALLYRPYLQATRTCLLILFNICFLDYKKCNTSINMRSGHQNTTEMLFLKKFRLCIQSGASEILKSMFCR